MQKSNSIFACQNLVTHEALASLVIRTMLLQNLVTHEALASLVIITKYKKPRIFRGFFVPKRQRASIARP